MWGRDKNFQVLMLHELRNCENQISLTEVFYCSPFDVYKHACLQVFFNTLLLQQIPVTNTHYARIPILFMKNEREEMSSELWIMECDIKYCNIRQEGIKSEPAKHWFERKVTTIHMQCCRFATYINCNNMVYNVVNLLCVFLMTDINKRNGYFS